MTAGGEWVLLCYRVPREPSTPRIAVWRRLKALGVAQVGDGVVALPADARTREHLEWVAEDVVRVGGSAMVWVAWPGAARQARELAERMRAARDEEYVRLVDTVRQATADPDRAAPGRVGALRRVRAELRRVERRDYFPGPARAAARAAVAALAADIDARTDVAAEAGR
ncbi:MULTISPECIES: Chromate resistance protein ChrB [Pseudonocardia]|uniref:ChrB N-terminal domain-containing protein n=1 Tax=Pseudonocardia autotrophica TaxID=2074 RepID=A0A1Y2MN96_PSEAH|nr:MULTISPECIES: Chromate resistance protein ChrB [Pseudonocardia]OSY36726.1 hypothetical protein BG845_05162 [Pseudonocardia autotrophica]OZM77434.1 chromate resistance protein [Pseudonocardia sp. MH-G8]TDN77159.1 hypothetical protein C8E95_6383 [Pseudonocardia autotrophica]